jgi:hypothetical protein
VTYYPDLGERSMLASGPQIRAVGWLSPQHEYSRGKVSDELLRLLEQHLKIAYQPVAFGGPHCCEFCSNHYGHANLLIPTSEYLYVAPEMILHYIREHGYNPPREFWEALRACPPQDSTAYMRALQPFHSYFRMGQTDPPPTPEQLVELAWFVQKCLHEVSRLCQGGQTTAAATLAHAVEMVMPALHGVTGWHSDLFVRVIKNSRSDVTVLSKYLDQYNSIFAK